MKDATIEIISEVKAHPDADRLDLVKILGFQCVTQKGLYKGGEKIVYIRPDAVLPIEPWTEEYRKYSPKRIKAVKLRGEFSEGIIVRFEQLPVDLSNLQVGSDVSEQIGVVHYEAPQPQDLQAKGYLPVGIGPTDEIRFENIIDELPFGSIVDVTSKVDGQSCSFYYNIETDEFGVLGRNLEMKLDAVNNYTAHVARYNIKNKLIDYCKKHNVSLCIRGESFGQGIQSSGNNPHSQKPKGWVMFSVYNIKERKYHRKNDRFYFRNVAQELELPFVDIIELDVELTNELIQKYSVGIDKIEGKPFEGVVINHENGSFKVINKSYDSKK
jgi:RNA ligase (TIGR02306 family)